MIVNANAATGDFDIAPSLVMPTAPAERTWPPTPYGVGEPLIPLSLEEGKENSRSLDGFDPPQGVPVIFQTFDDVLHYGETVAVKASNGQWSKSETAFFERAPGTEPLQGRRALYFPEQVKAWQLRDAKEGTAL